MLLKRQLNLNWFISLLAIVLMCVLIANSVLGSMYISNLKSRMTEITDNYFAADNKLHTALVALMQTRINNLSYINTLQSMPTNDENFIKIKANFLSEFQKNEVTLSSILFSLEKQEINGFMEVPISELTVLVTDYLLNMEKVYNSPNPLQDPNTIRILDNSLALHIKIKGQLETLAEIFRQRAYDVKASDNLIIQYFPPILFASFCLALLVGGSFIYVSRRELKKSVLEQTTIVLTEAQQYEQDCLQTLEICKTLLDSGIADLKKLASPQSHDKTKELQEKIAELSLLLDKLQTMCALRKNLHNKETLLIDDCLKKMRPHEK